MNTEQILKVLKNERECIARQSRPLGEMPQCRKDDDGVKLCEYCDLCLPDDEILEVYDYLISGYELTEIPISISKEESEALLALLKRSSFAVYPVPAGESYPTITVTTPDEMKIKDLVNIVEGTVEVYEKAECQTCVGDGDCFNCEYFDENAYNIGEESCSGEKHFEETEETLFKGVIEDVPYKLANKNVISVLAEHYKPYHKPREARTLIKIEVQGGTD